MKSCLLQHHFPFLSHRFYRNKVVRNSSAPHWVHTFPKQGDTRQKRYKRSNQPLSAFDYTSVPVCDVGKQSQYLNVLFVILFITGVSIFRLLYSHKYWTNGNLEECHVEGRMGAMIQYIIEKNCAGKTFASRSFSTANKH